MRSFLRPALLPLVWLLALGAAPPPRDAAIERALARIRPDTLRAHVAYLADDRLEGRGTGTPEYRRAADYVAARFKAVGLQPGAGDSWFQEVPMKRGAIREEECALAIQLPSGQEHELRYGTDYVMSVDFARPNMAMAARLAFVGFGVTAPELGWDDYAQVDVRGRVVVMLSGAPRSFPNDQRAYYSWTRGKEQNAVAHGARGIVVVRTPEDEARTTWERLLRQSRLPAFRWTGPTGEPHDTYPNLHVNATLNRTGAAALFGGSGWTPERIFAAAQAGKPPHLALPVQLRARHTNDLSSASSPNVVGLLRGSDPVLRDEVVVFTAHLDHLGISTPLRGDRINNGAYDNASGVAMIIEIGRALASLPVAPRRSILFVAVTGEEKGLQGSDYFVHFPPVPLERVVANVNLDMFLMLHPLRSVVAFGAEHSSLGPVVERAARALGLTVAPDPVPQEVVFIRSDQFSFVRAGVPAVFPTAGRGTTPADTTAIHRWMRTVYHTPQDDMNQRFLWVSGVKAAQLGLRIAHEVANAAERPTWNAGDFFGTTFARRP